MFTGIVTAVGSIAAIEERAGTRRVTVAVDSSFADVAIGASVSFAGICLTAVEVSGGRLVVEVGPETLRLTTAGAWQKGTRLNVERSLKVGDELGGHWVAGHIDGLAEIVGRQDFPETIAFRFAVPEPLAKFIATKGSIALDGTSLTVNGVEGRVFDCHLIPHTLKVTTWADRRVGDSINLEVDLIARYAERLLAGR